MNMGLTGKVAFTFTAFNEDLRMGGECHAYGITWGCDGGCPVFARGECKLEDVEAFRNQIMSSDRFNDFTFEELNNMYPALALPVDEGTL